ncbi:MAG: hypothetical protein ACTTKN_04490 [Phocaeicola sp.]|uniref:hypothetical protein n=1 Tax=Phocaeicola TaxID=909656 RepID=UPI00234E724E|nr:hypothetical protein [Phocaeicola oris]MCE2615619.1 hypothetical protein [Phocaeicola oris]
MNRTFNFWDRQFRNNNQFAFNNDYEGLIWLKVRAITRKEQLRNFLGRNSDIMIISKKQKEIGIELYEKLLFMNNGMQRLDDFLLDRSQEMYTLMNVDVERLKNDLYKVTDYKWGGDQNNSLDKFLVSHYVKPISSFDELLSKSAEIGTNAWDYVQNSWYNNWTSYLIEMLFENHQRVISAVGEIKSVDFFIDNYPVDLKVTFFPNQYLQEKLKPLYQGKSEMSWLKNKAKENNISFDSTQSDSAIYYQITESMSMQGITDVLATLNTNRRTVVSDAENNPNELMTWLYANQGEMRFGAENRIFVIMVNMGNMAQSWKMKREFSIIEPEVNSFLDNFNEHSLQQIDYDFKGNTYHSLSGIIFIKNR